MHVPKISGPSSGCEPSGRDVKTAGTGRRQLLAGGVLAAGATLLSGAASAQAQPATALIDTARLLDERAIERLLVRYASAVDERDLPGFDEVFVADATAYYGFSGNISGRAAIVDLVRATAEKCSGSQHLIGNFRINVEGDRATAKSSLQAILVGTGAYRDRHLTLWGEYRDRLERRPEGWRIVHRELVTLHATGDIGIGG